jgi:hypothetical protein
MKYIFYKKLILLPAIIAIPLNPENWKQIPYGSLPTHELSSENGLKISVKESASALVYQFEKPLRIEEVEITLTQTGKINYQGRAIGEKGGDDFPLRLGFVMTGDKKLSWSQNLIAPKWVKELYKLAPKSQGLDRVSYLVIAQEKPLYSKRPAMPWPSRLLRIREYAFPVLKANFLRLKIFKS